MSILSDYQRCVEKPHEEYLNDKINNLQKQLRVALEALENAQKHLSEFIGCRCNTEDCAPGDCSACRHMDAIEDIQEAIEQIKGK